MKANDAQEMLFEIQVRFAKAETEKEFDAVMQDFYLLQKEIDTWIPRISIGHYYGVVGTIRHVNNVAQARKALIESREQADKPA